MMCIIYASVDFFKNPSYVSISSYIWLEIMTFSPIYSYF